MLEFLGCIFSELTHAFCKHHQKTRNDEQIYIELKKMKQEETKKVEVYYERIQKLVHGLQVPTIDNLLTIMFRVGLQSYLKIVTTRMKQSTLQKHKEATMLCEEKVTIAEARSALSVPQNTKQVAPLKTHNNIRKIDKYCINCGMTNHNVETCIKKEQTTHRDNTTNSKTIEDIFVCMPLLWFEWT